MSVDDYINKIKNPPKYKPEMKFCAMQLGYYGNIPKKKIEALEAVFKHFRGDSFKDIVDLYRNEEDTNWFFQSETVGHVRGIVPMGIGNTYGTYDEFIKRIPQEDFDESYNSCRKVGSQRINYIKILTRKDGWDSINDKYMYIFYDSEGKIFIDKYATEIINTWSEDKLEEAIAWECVKIDGDNERVKQYRLTRR